MDKSCARISCGTPPPEGPEGCPGKRCYLTGHSAWKIRKLSLPREVGTTAKDACSSLCPLTKMHHKTQAPMMTGTCDVGIPSESGRAPKLNHTIAQARNLHKKCELRSRPWPRAFHSADGLGAQDAAAPGKTTPTKTKGRIPCTPESSGDLRVACV